MTYSRHEHAIRSLSAAELGGEAAAARLRPGAEAPRANSSVAGGTPAASSRAAWRRERGIHRAALRQARGPWPRSLPPMTFGGRLVHLESGNLPQQPTPS